MITGMMKVLETNYLIELGPTLTASSNNDYVGNIYDLDDETFWVSTGTDDTTTETIEIDFGASTTFNRIHLKGINWKEYKIQWLDGATWTDITILDSDLTTDEATIVYTANTYTSRYFEVNVTTEKILISATKTIVADEEKELIEFYVGNEVGTFDADLTSSPNSYDPQTFTNNAVILQKSNAGSLRISRGKKYQASFRIRQLWETADRTLIQNMYLAGSFVIYPCGGYRHYDDYGFRIDDFYHVVWSGNFSNPFSVGRDKLMGIDISFELLER